VPARPRAQINSQHSRAGPCAAGPYRERRQLAARWKKSPGPACQAKCTPKKSPVAPRPTLRSSRRWRRHAPFELPSPSTGPKKLPDASPPPSGEVAAANTAGTGGALIGDWWLVSNSPLGTPRGRYDEHSSKSSLSCETKVYRTSRRKPNFRR
jgi:hypothetical protein